MDGVNPSSCTTLLGEWITRLDTKQFHVTVCTLKDPDPAGEFLEKMGIKVYYLGFGKFSYKNTSGIRKLLELEHVDIAHLHGYSAANFGRIAARRKGIINIVQEHAVLRVLPHQYIADLLLRNYSDNAIAVSESVKKFMIYGRSIPASKIEVIFNGINLDKFTRVSQNTIQKKRQELEISDNIRIIGTVTRLREEKGNEYFIRAIPDVLKENSNVLFVIVGDGSLRENLERLTRELKVSQHVKFLGFRNDIVELLSIFDINVIPSLKEGFGLTLVEAMSVGNAIVVTRVGGLTEIANDGDTALFVSPRDPIEIGKKVSLLLEDSAFARNISKRAREVSREYSIERSSDLLGKLYLKLLKNH